MSIISFYVKLIKLIYDVYSKNIKIFNDRDYNIYLQR